MAQFGDLPCPEGWPNKRLYYDDRAECVCLCGKPTGERCTTTLTVYSDGACAQPLGSAMLSSDQPDVCIDTAPGSPFGSKAATPLTYQSGTCPATLYKSEVLTLCCLP